MSNEQEDEKRLYQCVNKYKTIVKQFDELIGLMSSRTKAPKRRRVNSSCRGSNNANQPASSSQPDSNEVFVQTISRFLQELRADSTTEPDGSTGTRKQD